jgi:hypothetical protein
MEHFVMRWSTMIRSLPVLALALTSSACLLPRSAVLGQTAAPMGVGGAEMAVSTGVAYQIDNTPPKNAAGQTCPNATTVCTSTQTQTLQVPSFEANAQIGFTDWLGLNLHVSTAGLQPGLKINLASGNFNFAVLPELAFGYAQQGNSTTTGTAANSTTTSGNTGYYFSFLVGAKLLASHSSGLYGAAGYDFQNLSTSTVDNKGFNQGSQSQQAHVISVNVGWSFTAGSIQLRPEMAVLILPSNTNGSGVGSNSAMFSGGSGLLLYPNLTIAAATSKASASAAPPEKGEKQPEGMKPEELELPPPPLMRAP